MVASIHICRIAIIFTLFICVTADLFAQAVAVGSGSWRPGSGTGTAVWTNGNGPNSSPAYGDDITISTGVTVYLDSGNQAAYYHALQNNHGNPTGFNLNNYPITLTGNVSGGCIGSAGSKLTVTGSGMTMAGTYTVDSLIFGGTGTKRFGDMTVYGNITVNTGVTLQENGTTTLSAYGSLTNNGTVNWASNYNTIRSYGNLINNGSWMPVNTYAHDSAMISGTGHYIGTNFYVDGRRTISGKVTIYTLEVRDTSRLYTGLNDTLVITGNSGTTGSGEISGTGTLMFAGSSLLFNGKYGASTIIMGGTGNKNFATSVLRGNVTVNSGVTLQENGNATLDIYGSLTNYGTVRWSSNYATVNMYGSVVNDGTWTMYATNVKWPAVISGTGDYNGNAFTVDTTCSVSGRVRFNLLTVNTGDTLNVPTITDTLVTYGPGISYINGVVAGSGSVYYNGSVNSSNTNVPAVYFGGSDQNSISGTYTAPLVVFSGTGTKRFGDMTVYGNITVNTGVTLQENGTTTLSAYGSLTNNGTVNWASNYNTIRSYGNLINNGSWMPVNTYAHDSAMISGTGHYIGTNFYVDGRRTISGKVTIYTLEVRDTSRLYTGLNDTLVITGNSGTTGSGEISGTGTLMFAGSSLLFNGKYGASTIIMGGTGNKNFATSVLRGNVTVNSGVTLQENGNATLDIYGSLTNYGTVRWSSNYATVNMYGSVVNDGTWTMYATNVKWPAVISGTGDYNGNAFTVDTTCSVSGRVRFNLLTVNTGDTLNVPTITDTLVTYGPGISYINGVVSGSGIVFYNGSVSSKNTAVPEVYFSGGTQNTVVGKYTVSLATFGGSGSKVYNNDTLTINGNVLIENGVSVVGNNARMYVNGNLTSYGSTAWSSSYNYMYIKNDLLNYGTWGAYYTTLTDTGLTAGIFEYTPGQFNIIADRRLAGNLTVSSITQLNGIITTGSSDTFIVKTANFTRVGGYINGNLSLPVTTGSPVKDFPLGNNYGYTPVTVNFSNVTTAGNMTVSLKTGSHPMVAYPDSALTRYWKFGRDADLVFASYSPTLRYLPQDFNAGITEPVNETTMVAGFKTPVRWIFPAITQRTPGGMNDGGSLVIGSLTECSDIVFGSDTNIFNANLPPVIVSSVANLVADEDFGSILIADLNDVFAEPEGAPMDFDYSLLVVGVSVSILNDSLYIHSLPDQHGTATIEISASDGYHTTRDTFTVTVDPVNDAPAVFSLLEPQNGDTLDYEQPIVTFTWNASQDVDGDTLEYKLYVWQLSSGEMINDTLITGITDTSVTVDLLNIWQNYEHYRWYVTAWDGQTTAVSADTFGFHTEGGLDVPEDPFGLPQTFALKQNYPNPFNPSTTIRYQLPTAGFVEMKIFNMLGQEVRTLFRERQTAGYYAVRWDGKNNQGVQSASGLYICRLITRGYLKSVKMLLLK